MLERLGKYRVERKLADGGMGAVYLGVSPEGRRVVLKVPHAQERNAAVALADEARTGSRLRHPGIVETLDFFVDAGVSVLVVAYIEGPTLFSLRKRGPLPPSAIAALGEQLAGALDAIHNATDEAGRPLDILHRDISPNNIIIDAEGQARLIDLGIARSADRRQKSTQVGMVKGTLRYLAPEILAGADHSRASDLWALGLTLWEAALARYAVPGDTMLTMRAAIDGSITHLQPGENLDHTVVEAIEALVAPIDRRLQNARAAIAVFSRLGARHPHGREALGAAVRIAANQAKLASKAPAPPVASVVDATEVLARPVMPSAAPVAVPSAVVQSPADLATMTSVAERSDIESVFTSTVSRTTISPTLLVPAAVDLPTVENAPTIQMPMWKGQAGSTVPNAPVTRSGAATDLGVDPGASTRLSIPAARVDAGPSAPPVDASMSAPTIQLPAFQELPAEQSQVLPQEARRTESLFLNVVVVDDLPDEPADDER